MKYLLSFFLACFLLLGCSSSDSDDDIMSVIEEEMEEEMMGSMEGYSMGNFVSLAHPTSGVATISSDKSQLILKDFKTDSGPLLLLYLSTDNAASEYVNLGELKGLEGDFVYDVPANTDVDKFNIVNVWCVDFLVSFGVAELQKN